MKLFRKIRQKLIKEGNLKRYFLYALGEILLVMIGITLAFQLDNWNDDRIKRSAELNYYENISSQISVDKQKISDLIALNKWHGDQFKFAIELVERNDTTQMDTLGLIIRNLTQYSDFDRQGNIYETMVNSGEIKLLKNNEIVDGLRVLEEKYIYINRMENIHYDAMMTYVVPAINPVLKMTDASIKEPEMIFNHEFQNLLVALIGIITEKEKVYKEAIREIDLITDSIGVELNYY